jgi:hypothetical protein
MEALISLDMLISAITFQGASTFSNLLDLLLDPENGDRAFSFFEIAINF